MILERISLRNFRQHAETTVTFTTGIVGIVGPNEAGKSGLLEAVAWAIYGSKGIRNTMDGVRWQRAASRQVAAVDVTFQVGGTRYRIERTENDATMWELLEGTEGQDAGKLKIAAGRSHVDAKAPEVVGMSWEEFRSTFLSGQKDLDRLSRMGPTERQSFFLEVLGIDAVDVAIARVRKEKKRAKDEASTMAEGLGPREPVASRHAEAVEAHLTTSRDLDDAGWALSRARIAEKEAVAALDVYADGPRAAWLEAAEGVEAAQRALDLARQRLADREGAIESVRNAARQRDVMVDMPAELEAAEERLERLEAEKAAVQRVVDLMRTRDEAGGAAQLARESVERRLEILESYDADAHAEADAAVRQARAEVVQARTDHAARRAELDGQRKAALAAGGGAVERLADLRDAGETGVCPTCRRLLSDAFEAAETSLVEWVARANGEAERIARELEDMGKEPTNLRTLMAAEERKEATAREWGRRAHAAEQARGELPAYRVELAEHEAAAQAALVELDAVGPAPEAGWEDHADALQRQVQGAGARVADLRKRKQQWDRLDAVAATLPKMEEAIEAGRESVALSEADVEHERATLAAVEYDEDRWLELRAVADAAAKELARAEERVKAADSAQAQATKVREAAAAELERYDERTGKLAELRTALRLCETVEERLLDFRRLQVAGIRPELEALASGIVQLLTDGRHEGVRVTEDYDLVLLEGGREQRDISGGASDLLALAQRIALSEMVAAKSGTPSDALWLDEPFAFLDATRRQNVVALLRRLGGVFPQVLVISHFPDTQDTVDVAISVEYDDGAGRAVVTGGAR